MFVLPTFNLGVVGSSIVPPFIIDDVDTESNIHSTSPTNPTGEYTIAFGSNTHDLYVWTGTLWVKFSND